MSDRAPSKAGIDWSLGTWEGNRRAQLRSWRRLSLRERLEALDDMNELAEAFAKARADGRLRSPRRV
jgi:hypothetical protein